MELLILILKQWAANYLLIVYLIKDYLIFSLAINLMKMMLKKNPKERITI